MAPPQLTVGKYNPAGYVPGGSSPLVAAAIQKKAFTPYNPAAYVPGGSTPAVAKAIQTAGFGGTAGPIVTLPYSAPVLPTTTTGGGVAPTPYTPPPPKTNIFGASRPDIASIIAGDYSVGQAETDMASEMGKANDQFTQSVRQALIDLGVGDTSQLGKFGSYIDQDTLSKAIANKYSQNAQIANQQRVQSTQTAAALAARGILNSGQLASSATGINQTAEQNRYGALTSFLNSGESGLSSMEDLRTQLLGAVAQARSGAADRAQVDLTNWLNYQDELDKSQGSTQTPAPPATTAPPVVPAAAKKPVPKPPAYNPYAYVPGGSSQAVSKAIVAAGKKK